MKYSVEIRMNNHGPAKYLIDSKDHDSFMEAFQDAQIKAEEVGADHFVQIVDNNSRDVVAYFPVRQ